MKVPAMQVAASLCYQVHQRMYERWEHIAFPFTRGLLRGVKVWFDGSTCVCELKKDNKSEYLLIFVRDNLLEFWRSE